MRLKNKVFCDCCGKFTMQLTKKQVDFISQERHSGTRVVCSVVCDNCAIRNEERLKRGKLNSRGKDGKRS